MLARLQETAAGSGLPSQPVLDERDGSLPLVHGRQDGEVGAMGGCSAVAVRGSHAENGDPIVAKNFDWHADRARRLEQLVQAQKPIGANSLAAIMSDHGPSGVPDGASPCVHTDYVTTASLQWFPARRSVRASYSTACQANYVEIAL